jgi:hypothetical protein
MKVFWLLFEQSFEWNEIIQKRQFIAYILLHMYFIPVMYKDQTGLCFYDFAQLIYNTVPISIRSHVNNFFIRNLDMNACCFK